MQDYFNQYAEEYYEETDEVEEAFVASEKSTRDKYVESLDDIISLLESERVSDLVVLSLGPNGPGSTDTMVICSPFNSRHGHAVAESLRKAARMATDGVTKRSVRGSFGWFQVQIGQTQVHVMSAESRVRFDIEGLWGAGEPEPVDDDLVPNIPPPRTG